MQNNYIIYLYNFIIKLIITLMKIKTTGGSKWIKNC